MAEQVIIVSHQTVRLWAEKLGRRLAADTHTRSKGQFDGKWLHDEVVIKMRGQEHWAWPAIDQDGFVLDVLVQKNRKAKACSD